MAGARTSIALWYARPPMRDMLSCADTVYTLLLLLLPLAAALGASSTTCTQHGGPQCLLHDPLR
jgi:hypothetical protein